MIAVLAVHLLLVDLAMAGPLVAVGLQWRARHKGDAAAGPLARRLAGWSMAAAAVGIGLGLAALALTPHVESEAYRQALAKIPASRWWFVGGELAFYFVCMAAYVGPWQWFQRRPRWHALLAILAGTDLMYHFPPLFSVISTLSMRPNDWHEPLNHALYWKLLLEGQTLTMVLHHWLAGISVAAMAAVVLNMANASKISPAVASPDAPAPGVATSKSAARIALVATLLQLPVGIGVLLSLPTALENPLLGDDWISTVLFGLSVVLALGLLHHLAMIALGEVRRGAILRTAAIMAATILLMTATLQRARHIAEKPTRETASEAPSHHSTGKLVCGLARSTLQPLTLWPPMSPNVITLVDPATGATARILPGVGFNCFSFQPTLDDRPIELLWSEESFASGQGRSTRSGIPILFPFPGRLSGTTLRFGGREVPLVIDPHQGCAIHGFVHNRPWRVLESRPASVTGEFHAAKDDPKLLDLWPADFRIRVCYELNRGQLESTLTIDNPGDRLLPFGLGTHGYFRVPLDAGAAGRDGCLVFVPARSYWELEKMFPTGRKLPADGPRNLTGGKPFGETHLDDVLADLQSSGGRVVCRMLDPGRDRRMAVEFDDSFHNCVVFNPTHREAICLEPYSCVPNAYALTERGIDAGLRVLQPGESFQAKVAMRLEPI